MFCLKSAPSSLLLLSVVHFPAACWLLSHNPLHRIFFSVDCLQHFHLLFLFFFFKHLTIRADTSFLNSFGSPITACFRDFIICWSLTLVSPLLTYLLFSFPCFLKECHVLFFSCMTSLSQSSAVSLILRGWTLVLLWLSYLHRSGN